MNKKNQKGFTLVELIVVIAIVAILAAVGIVGYTQFISNARDTKAQSELDQLVNVLYAASLEKGVEIDETKILEVPQGGKIKFYATVDEAALQLLINEYAEGLEGKFSLVEGTLAYSVNGGEGSANVIGGPTAKIENVEYQAPTAQEEGGEEGN